MAATGTRTEEVRALVQQLIAMIQTGREREAQQQFYAPDAVILDGWRQEYPEEVPGQDLQVGVGNDVDVREAQATMVLVDGDSAAISWRFVVAARHGVRKGEAIPLRQVTLQVWRGRQVVREEIYVG